MESKNKIKYLRDYLPPNYQVQDLSLLFDIREEYTLVTSIAKYILTTDIANLTLNGSCELVSIKLDHQEYTAFQWIDGDLFLADLPQQFDLEIVTKIYPAQNKSCMGLYASNGNLFTQNEPEGFRKITFYQDRSDVMAKFTTTIIGDKDKYPIMLSNGNKIHEEELTDNRHLVTWEDPFKKPSYLFALVAGQFSVIQDYFVTKSQRKILLEVYSEASSISQCQHSMDSLKRSMQWDQERFNLEYDLDRYMIVASGDFNMGAMENKGLNIFNTKYVLADSKTATDGDFINVEAVVGHEYFHNWTGNRVTCRDWFQLSLKEGLTVFRDQEFTSDLHSRSVKRINDVRALRQRQFPEDASPLAHPVRPESYLEINNFYTVTVYEKGAEVVRMYQTLLGKSGFNRGLELYLARHDGEAATCENFCQAMADANERDLTQFMLWYSQAGTPILKVSDNYDEQQGTYTLTIEQKIPVTTNARKQQAMLIPVAFELLTNSGDKINFLPLVGEIERVEENNILLVTQEVNHYTFKVTSKPTPSLLRGFSAPVIINYPYTNEQIELLAMHDDDSFNRWDALQNLYKQEIMAMYHNHEYQVSPILATILRHVLQDNNLDSAYKNALAILPDFAELSAQYQPVDVHDLVLAIAKVKAFIADQLIDLWLAIYADNQSGAYNFNDAGRRALKNTALYYLMASNDSAAYLDIVKHQYTSADNMTDKIGALVAINDSYVELRNELLIDFANSYKNYPLVMDKWFTLQAQSQRNDTLDMVQELTQHPAFDGNNPNKIYALVRAFTMNGKVFNTQSGYEWIAQEMLRVDAFNPSVAGRVANGFAIISSLSKKYHQLLQPILADVLTCENLSKDVYELISKTYAQISD